MNIRELEARLKEIDARAESEVVEASLEGETESSVTLNVSTWRPEPEGGVDQQWSPGSPQFGLAAAETVLDVSLSDVVIPDEYVDRKVFEVFSNEETTGLLPGVVVKQPAAGQDYEVVEDYTYASGGYSITAPKGFVYDRASIPRVFWAVIDKDDLSNVPPLFHDLLYRHGGRLPDELISPYRTFERVDVDDLFYELMLKTGVKTWRAKLAYQAVRKFAGFAWRG
ncbi:MAG TPA: DUF1353 domain-containing protein [Pyrinomonadaceae bacterium]|jgi:hypothetical protein